jgi:hypothetical protein
MSLTHWLSERLRLSSRTCGVASRSASKRKALARQRTFRPGLECLEDRWLPSTLTVLNNLDSGAGSLRADIAAAHNGDTIVFATNLNGQTITLTSGELLLKHNLTIAGPGPGNLTVSGNHTSRIFEVAATVSKPVTLSGLTISNGLAAGSTGVSLSGGGILNQGTLTVSNCTQSGNTTGKGGSGGGIENDGTLTVSGSTLSANTAPDGSVGGAGGGIYNSGPLTVSGSTLSGNYAWSGGAIFNTGGTVTVNAGSILSGNSAGGGGAIYNQSGTIGSLTINASTLSGNSARVQGGGIFDLSGTVTVSGSTLSGNSAILQGGGIYVASGTGNQACTVTVSGSTLSGNLASQSGGGIYVNAGMVTLTNDTVQSNTATGYGGGLYIASGSTVSLDAFTVANIINNTDSSGLNGSTANIDGLYTLLP